MNDDKSESGSSNRSFMDRIVHAIGGEPRDQEELLELLRDAQARQIFDADTLQMVEGAFQVVEMRVRDIMIPRAQMVVVNRAATLDELLPVITDSGHSRFPVIDEDKDDVVGVLLAKDLLKYSSNDAAEFDMASILRTVTMTPETKRLNVLLKEFRAQRNHMAIVLDEYGGVAGLVTIEDVLEEIVGEIDDEHDTAEDAHIRRVSDRRYQVNALTPIEDFNDTMGTSFSDDEFDTIGGLVMQHIGHMPKEGETAVLDGCQFRIMEADSRRVHLMLLSLSFAPLELWWLAPVCIGCLYALIQPHSARRAALYGFLFGLGYFGFGVSWVYNSLHVFGGAALPVAVLLTAMFVVVMAFFPCATAYVFRRLTRRQAARLTLTNAAFFASLQSNRWALG